MLTRIVVLGAGFGGLELTTILSEALGDAIDLLLIDRNESFVFGSSKLDVMFGRRTPGATRHAYAAIAKPGVRFLRTTVQRIDPAARRVVTADGAFDADILVVALGADLDLAATPGLAEGGNEFYTTAGAFALREALEGFAGGPVIVGATSAPFKCPPAPSEAAFLLHDFLTARGLRERSDISVVLPLPRPIPPSPQTSDAILAGFAERGINFVPERRIVALDAARHMARVDDGSELPYALYLGIPVHRAPAQVREAFGVADDGWAPVDPRTLATPFDGVYAIGDVADIETPMAGVFAEGQARVAAASILARLRGEAAAGPYDGAGSCYIEFGGHRVARVDVNFLSGPKPTAEFQPPSEALAAEKGEFGASRVRRWFGRAWTPTE